MNGLTDDEREDIHSAIQLRLTWASLHWGTEDVHPDAWRHITKAAADEAERIVQQRVDAALAPIEALRHEFASRGDRLLTETGASVAGMLDVAMRGVRGGAL
ncbi:hypothetical protein [Nocardioides sp. LHG3406-4]|uniref:hypothetical protein n=1 Tax=Nocardioides sp. LHG3406-4 TaxID=2804575 RepID=UPI003CEAD55E